LKWFMRMIMQNLRMENNVPMIPIFMDIYGE
jgi:hypothetical protein